MLSTQRSIDRTLRPRRTAVRSAAVWLHLQGGTAIYSARVRRMFDAPRAARQREVWDLGGRSGIAFSRIIAQRER